MQKHIIILYHTIKFIKRQFSIGLIQWGKGKVKGEGAILFIIAFLIFLGATLTYTGLPPGSGISDSMGIDPTIE
jgi:hypothetical protein